MLTLQQFVNEWSTNTIVLPPANHTTPSQQPYRLRPSRLGRPAYVTAIEYLVHLHGNTHKGIDNTEYYGRTQDIFRTGHDVEARIVEVMRSANVEHFEYQVPTTFEMCGFTIEGTADVVINDTVVDIKTASASNFKRLLTGYNDLPYRTQLALYAHGLNVPNVALLLYNKDTSELQLKSINLTTELDRVQSILTELKCIKDMSLEDAFEYAYNVFEVTTPPAQRRDKLLTGNYLVPPELYYEPLVRDILWTTEVRNGTRYITGDNQTPCTTIRNSFI